MRLWEARSGGEAACVALARALSQRQLIGMHPSSGDDAAKALKAARDAWSGAERAKLGEAVEKRRAAIKNDAIAALEPALQRWAERMKTRPQSEVAPPRSCRERGTPRMSGFTVWRVGGRIP